jgi:hypothetical protein
VIRRLTTPSSLYGGDYEVSVQLEDYTDAQMLVALVDENAGNEESIMAQVDVIRLARKFIKANPAACKFDPSRRPRGVDLNAAQKAGYEKLARASHKCGSQPCLQAFLGEENWGNDKMHKLVTIADDLDSEILKEVWLTTSGVQFPASR